MMTLKIFQNAFFLIKDFIFKLMGVVQNIVRILHVKLPNLSPIMGNIPRKYAEMLS